MAINPYFNKVIKNGTTLIDISDTSAVAADVAQGKKFYDASGAPQTGTASGGKTIASIRTGSVPAAFTYELIVQVLLAGSTTSNATLQTYKVDITNESSQDPDDWAVCYYSSGDLMVAQNNATFGESLVLDSEETVSCDVTAARLGYYSQGELTDSNFEYMIGVAAQNIKKIVTNDGLTYTLSYQNGMSATVTFNSDATTVDGVVSIEIVGVRKTPTGVYGPGYVVTYTDNSTEQFLAVAADVADGSY